MEYILKTFTPSSYSTKINKLIISGRGTLVPGVKNLIKGCSNTNTELANPFHHLDKPLRLNPKILEHYSPACLLVTGLALRNIRHVKG
jgi:Tfp pilus assembly PilM family ATPase